MFFISSDDKVSMGTQVNTFMIGEYDEALSLQNEMQKNSKALAWSNVSKTHASITQPPSTSTPKPPSKGTSAHEAPTIHKSDTLDDGSGDTSCNIPMIKLSSTEKENLSAPWKYSLIAKVLGRKVGLQYCQAHLHRLWSLEGTVDIIDLGYGFFLLKFSLPTDYIKVFKGVPWLIHGYYISLRPWVPNFKPSEATITHAKVWVRLPELPIEYYDKEVLLQIGAAIGRTIKIDPITEKQARGRFARMCVEVDLKHSLLPQIKLGELQQKIEYEGYVEQLQQDYSPCPPLIANPTHSYSSSHTKFVHPNPLGAPNASQNVASNNRKTSIDATWLRVPCWQRKCPQKTETDSGSQGPKVPKEKAMTGTGLSSSGSRFSVLELENHLDPAVEPKPSKGKSEHTSVSTSSPHNGKNIGSKLGQKQCPKAGEGKSLSAALPIAATKLSMPEETLSNHVEASVEPKVLSRLCNPMSVKQPQDSLKQVQKPHTSSPLLSSTLSSSKVVASSFSKGQQPTQDDEVYLPLPASFRTTSTPTEIWSPRCSNLVMKNASCTAPTSLSLNQPQPTKQSAIPQLSPMPDATIQFHSEVMQRSTKQRKIKSIPGLVQLFQELSTESSPTVFSIDSAISDIEISVSISPLPTGKANHHSISFSPSKTNHNMHPLPKGQAGTYQNVSKAIPEPHPKKLLCWNCRGAGELKFMRAIKDLIKLHEPSIVVLLEPKISGGDADQVIKEIGFSGQYHIDPEGFAHGIWILWQTEDVRAEVTSSTPHQIHLSVQVLSEAFDGMLCGVGADTDALNGIPYEVDDNLEPFTQHWDSSFFYTSESLMYPPTSEWVPFSKEVEVGQISSWA